MARVNPELLEKLRSKTGLSRGRVYELIGETVRATHLPRSLAAIALASDRGINISRYATDEELATIRNAARSAAPPPVVVPETLGAGQQPIARRGAKRTRRGRGPARRGTSVFVVHGRNEKLNRAMFAFLRALGLKPIEFVQAIGRTSQGSPYVGTILERAFGKAAAVVVLMTPDDVARLKPAFRKRHDPPHESKLTGQARPNVLFEAGMAFGHNPGSTVLVEVGNLRPFSDVGGRHVVHLSDSATSRRELATKLANAGCNVDTEGSDWLDEGDFTV